MKFLIIIPLTTLFFGCKTAEDIAREKRIEEMSVQVVEHQKQLVDSNIKNQELENRLNQIYGQLEETEHEKKQEILKKEEERLRTLTEVTERLKVMEDKIEDLESQVKTQSEFITEVTSALKDIKGGKIKSRGESNSKNDSLYSSAMADYNAKKYNSAKEKFNQLLTMSSTSAVRKVRSWYALGHIFFKEKKYEDSMIFFSKVYANYPKSSRAPSSLLYIAKSFIETKQIDDAKGSLNQIIQQYPKAKESKEAKELLSKI